MKDKVIENKYKLVLLTYLAKGISIVQISGKIVNTNCVEFDFCLHGDLRKKIRKSKCFCTWECALNTNILFNIKYYPRVLKEMISLGMR